MRDRSVISIGLGIQIFHIHILREVPVSWHLYHGRWVFHAHSALCRLREHYAHYEPTLRELKTKYESAMKEKMLTRLERDRAVGQAANAVKGVSLGSAGASKTGK